MINENMVLYFEEVIKSCWNNPAFSDYKGQTYIYADVAKQIAKIHLLFEQNGIDRGDKVALLGKNSSNWAIVFLASVSYGAVIVPILPDFKPNDILNILNHSGSKLVFVGESFFEIIDTEKTPEIQSVISINDYSALFSRNEQWAKHAFDIEETFKQKYPEGLSADKFFLPQIANTELAEISYTSGTTGFSKGVMLLHNSLAANLRFARNNMPLSAGDKIVSFLPLAHAYGCAFEFLFPFSMGCHITFLTKTPSPQIIIQAFAEVKPRLILSVPLIIEKIYKKQLLPVVSKPLMRILLHIPVINKVLFKKIREKLMTVFGGNFYEIVIGGAAFNSEAEAFMRKIKFPFTVGYGMTECGPLISYSTWTDTKLHSAGKPVDSLKVKIDSYDPYSIVGEILVKGDNVMAGYYKNEEATKAVIDDEGWLHTGDQGLIDKEGNIYIKGRSKAMILGPSGQNIYPEEIESVLNNKDCVLESLIVEDNGMLVALIYPDFECVESKHLTEDEMREMFNHHLKDVNHHIPNYMKISRYIIQSTEFEKTPKRSIKRFMYGVNN